MTVARLVLASLLLLLGLPVTSGASGPGGSYELVDLDGQGYRASSLAFTREGIKVATPAGLRTLDPARVDWYETFHRNVRSGATNLVAFKSGSILRFDRFELADGSVKLTIAGGGDVSLAESLIDFEESVREGAMVKLPENAGAAVAVTKSTGAGWTDEGGNGATGGEVNPASARSRRSASLASRRRAGLGGPTPPEDGATAADAGESSGDDGGAPMDLQPPGGDVGGDSNNPGGPPFGSPNDANRRGGLNRNSPRQPGGPSDGSESGQVVVAVATDYSGPIGGLQLTLTFPPNMQVVEPVTFTGFAGNWLAMPNPTVAGQLQIGGAAPGGTSISGGEFLRVTMLWNGTPPSQQSFRIAELKVSSEEGSLITDFRTTLDVQMSP